MWETAYQGEGRADPHVVPVQSPLEHAPRAMGPAAPNGSVLVLRSCVPWTPIADEWKGLLRATGAPQAPHGKGN